MSIESVAKEMNQDLKSKSKMKIGEKIKHPDGRTVLVKSGYFLDPTYGRVSNFWYWNEVLENGSLGPDESGYGW